MTTKPEENDVGNVPRQLPIVTINGKQYFEDRRLGEYRAVDNPHDRIPTNDTAGLLVPRSMARPEGMSAS